MKRLEGKVALVTGAGSGIGAATVGSLAAEGAAVVIADKNGTTAEAVARDLIDHGGTGRAVTCDVTVEEQVARAISTAVEEFGGLDILHNNAGAPGPMGIEGVSIDAWDQSYSLLLRSVVLGVKHAVPAMKERGGGSIISTSSGAGIRPLLDNHAYGSLKAAVIMLTRSLAFSLGPSNIRVNAIAPGWIITPMLRAAFPLDEAALEAMAIGSQPLPHPGRPEDVAEAVVFLASDAARFISGVTIPVDGAYLTQNYPQLIS